MILPVNVQKKGWGCHPVPSPQTTSDKMSLHRKRPAEVEAATGPKSCIIKMLLQLSFREANSIVLVPREDRVPTHSLDLHSATGRLYRNRQGEA